MLRAAAWSFLSGPLKTRENRHCFGSLCKDTLLSCNFLSAHGKMLWVYLYLVRWEVAGCEDITRHGCFWLYCILLH